MHAWEDNIFVAPEGELQGKGEGLVFSILATHCAPRNFLAFPNFTLTIVFIGIGFG